MDMNHGYLHHFRGHRQSLLDEGSLMRRLNHERVVKLLGVILEDGDYSLVMELIPKGNLLNMLDEVSYPGVLTACGAALTVTVKFRSLFITHCLGWV